MKKAKSIILTGTVCALMAGIVLGGFNTKKSVSAYEIVAENENYNEGLEELRKLGKDISIYY